MVSQLNLLENDIQRRARRVPATTSTHPARSAFLKSAYVVVTTYYAIIGSIVGTLRGREALLVFLRQYLRTITRTLRIIGRIELVIVGTYLENPGRSALILPTHESVLDTILGHGEGFNTCYVAKHELFGIPWFGKCMRIMQMIPINRKKPDIRTLIRDVKKALSYGRHVFFFPSGTREPMGIHRSVLPGTFPLIEHAFRMGIPVVPVTMQTGACWGKGLFGAKPGTMRITFGVPLRSREPPTNGAERTIFRQEVKDELIAVWSYLGTRRV